MYYELIADIENNKEYIGNNFVLKENHYITPHYHDGIEILCFYSGEGYVQSDGEKINVKSGDIAVCNSRQIHTISAFSELKYRYIILKKNFLKKYNFPYKEKYLINKFQNKEIADFCKFICNKENETQEWYSEKAHAYLMLIAVTLFSQYTDSERIRINSNINNKTKTVIDIMDYIGDNCEKSFSLEEIAVNVGYSKYYICKIFKELANQTIIEYINRLKCSKAIEDLKSGEYTVYETANKYGFENFSYFSEIFKKYTGKSPSYFKKS